MSEVNFIKLYESSFKENWYLNALTDLTEATTYTYGDLATKIARIHIIFHNMEIKRGDKIALVGSNHSSWVFVFMATITYGAVIVPILSNFHPDSIENIIIHSDAKLCFIEQNIWNKFNSEKIVIPVLSLPFFDTLNKKQTINDLQLKVDDNFIEKYPIGFNPNDVNYEIILNDTVVCINYTSGYKTFTRGVMLTAENYYFNILAINRFNVIYKGEKNIVFLPLAHAFSCMADFLSPLSIGAHLHLLPKINNPKTLFEYIEKHKPNYINIVPFLLESVCKTEMLQMKRRAIMNALFKIPLLNMIIYRKIRKSMINVFGGNYRELIVGGASLNKDVEDFLVKIKFPFTVGYGMTECGPLISYSNHKYFSRGSCGKVIESWMEVRIDSINPLKVPGEIQVRGKHVMKGYYKDDEATKASFTKDGWFKTGDIGTIDRESRLYIKGLIKNMILGSSGQNIYPQVIELELNKLPFVSESLVIGKNNLLRAFIYPDFNQMDEQNISIDNLEIIMKNNRKELNKRFASYERIFSIEILDTKFERNEDNSIKREMYD